MLKNKKERTQKEINAGSMADIAFLLLIFFLVTTTISAEKGIAVKLPPWEDDPSKIVTEVHQRNVLSVKVNKNNELLVEGNPMEITELRAMSQRFIMNYGVDPNLSETPKRAVVSLQNDRSTSYDAYISVYNEIKGAYNEIWEEKAKEKHSVSFEALPKPAKKAIQDEIPLVISEAEPVAF